MNAIRKAGGLLLGVALMAGCTERNASTGPTGRSTGALSADVTTANSSVVSDPAGDVAKGTQGYLDIIGARITKKGGVFVFTMDLATALPDNPPVPSSADMIEWHFSLDTDPTAFPAGYPFTKNSAGFQDFLIEHRVYRSGFTDPFDPTSSPGILTDRRPLLTGGQPIVAPITFSIDGAKLTWVVDAALLNDPSTFQWGLATAAAHAGADVKNGYNTITLFDVAPEIFSGAPLATWPQ